MKDNHIVGTIHKIFDQKTVSEKKTVRDFVIKTDGDYAQLIPVQTVNAKTEILNGFSPGDRVKVMVNIGGKEDRNVPDKYYASLTAWKMEKL